MADGGPSASPLEAAAETAGAAAAEAFATLGNATRLAILLALWEAYEPRASANAVPFSALRERVGVRDSGQFNYHLKKLEGRFVRRTDEGYLLRPSGRKLVRAVVAGIGGGDEFEPRRLALPCPRCGAAKEIVYEEEVLYLVCTGCEGAFAGTDEIPRGTLSAYELDPAGLRGRDAEAIAHAGWARALHAFGAAIEGVCNECSGAIEGTLDVCRDHEPDGVCGACGRGFAVMVEFDCPVCKNHHSAPPRTVVAHHPAVVAFYWERGVAFQYDTTTFEHLVRRGEFIEGCEQTLVETDPPRVRVTVRHEDDALQLLVDETLAVTVLEESE